MVRGPVLVLLVLAAQALLPSAANAVTRHAAPLGTGMACSSDMPCDIGEAIDHAGANDEVIVTTGDYGSEAAPLTQAIANTQPGLDVHGEDGKPRPRIFVAVATNDASAVSLTGAGTRVRHLEIRVPPANGSRQAALVLDGVSASDIVVHTAAAQGKACVVLHQSTLAGSQCVATATNAFGVTTYTGVGSNEPVSSTLRNVTAIASATGGRGIQVQAGNNAGQDQHLTITDTIARGEPNRADIGADDPPGAQGVATIAIDHSNFGFESQLPVGSGTSRIVQGPGNQQFKAVAFAGADDFHQAPGAVTIDAGADDPANGTVDNDGDPRPLGARTDIGADEFVPPPAAVTDDPGALTTSTAAINGTVNPERLAATYHFEYGTTTAYGSSTPETDAGDGAADVPVTATLSGLAPGTAYHYRLVATGRGGTTPGADKVATTESPPGGGGDGGGDGGGGGVDSALILKLALAPQTFRAARKGGSVRAARKRRPVGTTVSIRLNRAAVVRFTVTRKRKTRYVPVRGSFSRKCKAGGNKFRFTGRVRKHKLRPGRYRLVAATGKAPPKRARFRIVRR